jgi:4,5-DOPA dioxygenase extradiol
MKASGRMPAIFVGHGSPMNALADNRFTQAWRAIGANLPRPRAVVAVSAHWFIDCAAVTAMPQPRTIHDFGGFPRALHEVRYPAPGHPELAAEIMEILAPLPVRADHSWGLDHGVWSILMHVYPQADVPVVEFAIDARKSAAEHFNLGAMLVPLRDQQVLVMASGNIVHNLTYFDPTSTAIPDWAQRFDRRTWDALVAHDAATLIEYDRDPDAPLAAPDTEHYLPLLYVAGMRVNGDGVNTIVEGFDAGCVSMRSVQIG